MVRKLIVGFALIAAFSACGKPSAGPAAASPDAETAPKQVWKTYEDDWIRVQYPEKSDVGGAENGRQSKTFPTFAAVPQSPSGSVLGAFTLQLDPKTKGILLRDAIQTEISSHIKPRGALLFGPRDIKIGNGKCLNALVTAPSEFCSKGEGSCHTPYFLTLCDGPDGRRYTATTLLSTTRDPNSLSPQAQQEAAVYERILRSLEFKKS